MQMKVRRECEKIYPDIVWRSTAYVKDGKPCVRVEIEYSGDTPHLAERLGYGATQSPFSER